MKRGSSDVVGSAGRLEADAPVWAAPLLGFEVRLEVAVLRPKSYQALPTQPPVERDVDGLFEHGLKVLEDELGVRRRES